MLNLISIPFKTDAKHSTSAVLPLILSVSKVKSLGITISPVWVSTNSDTYSFCGKYTVIFGLPMDMPI